MRLVSGQLVALLLACLFQKVVVASFSEFFKEAVGWISDFSTIIGFSEQLGALYTCGGLCSTVEDRTNANVIEDISVKLLSLGTQLSTLQFEEKVNNCYDLAMSRNNQLAGSLSALDSDNLAEAIAEFDNSGGRTCLDVIHNAVMGSGLVASTPALTLYYDQAKTVYEDALKEAAAKNEEAGDDTASPEDQVPKTLQPFYVVEQFWSRLLELQHITFAQTVWGVERVHELNSENSTSSITTLMTDFQGKISEQVEYARRFFGCRTLRIGWVRLECRNRGLVLHRNQTERVHAVKLFHIAANPMVTAGVPMFMRPFQQLINPDEGTTELSQEASGATEVVLVDSSQPEPSQWEVELPQFCLMDRRSGLFLTFTEDMEPALADGCSERSKFELHTQDLESGKTDSTEACGDGLTKGTACCSSSCSRCSGFQEGSDGCTGETAVESGCCAFDILKNTGQNNICSESTNAPCVMEPELPFALSCFRSVALGYYLSFGFEGGEGEAVLDGTVTWNRDAATACSKQDGTVWRIYPLSSDLSVDEQETVDDEQNNSTTGGDVQISQGSSLTSFPILLVIALVSMFSVQGEESLR